MKKLPIIIISVLLLTGCSHVKPQPNSQVDNQNINQVISDTSNQKTPATYLTASYLPTDWIIENNTYYSPEMYNMREGGPYSLMIKINKDFPSIEEYLSSKSNCIENKAELLINNYTAVQFVNSCAYGKPKVTVIEMDNNLIEALSYSVSDENKEIIKILNSLELPQ